MRSIICGAGFIGKIHANAYKNIKNIKLVGFFDLNQNKVQKVSEEFGVKAYNDFKQILKDETIDIIDICVPTFLHKEFVEKSLKAGKHVLCEKPITLELKDAYQIINLANNVKTKFMIGHTHRFYIENVLVQKAAEMGKLGKVVSCSAYRWGVQPDWSENNWIINASKSGGAATDFILHDIDLCNWIGGKPEIVMAQGIRNNNGGWDYMGISIGYENGIKGFVEGGWIFKGEWPFTQIHRIIGKSGVAQWTSKMDKNIEGRNVADSKVGIFIEGKQAEYLTWEKKDPFEAEIEYFVECIENDKNIDAVKAEDAILALKVSLAAKESAEKLIPVKIK
jgi:predicted dehydrogenase